MANTYQLISSQVLGSNTANVTFSSIPSTFSDLVIQMSMRGDLTNLATAIRYNSTASAYSIIDLFGQATTGTGADGYFTNSEMDTTRTNQANSNFTSNYFTFIEFYIPYYASSLRKAAQSTSVADNASTSVANVEAVSTLWNNTTAISSILIFPRNSSNFITGSSFYLYGIKNS
jgi:hypothetical protein